MILLVLEWIVFVSALLEIKTIKKRFFPFFVTFTFTFDSDTTFISGIDFFIAVKKLSVCWTDNHNPKEIKVDFQ